MPISSPKNFPVLTIRKQANSVIRYYNRSTAQEKAEGSAWYPTANLFAYGLADRYDLRSVDQAAGIIAALSPQVSWGLNQRLAVLLCATGDAPGLGKNVAKALAILGGNAPLDTLGGPKVRAFYGNIIDPIGDAVTVDRHAIAIANDHPICAKPGRAPTLAEYEVTAEAYRRAARFIGERSVAEIQATTWLVRRRLRHPNNRHAFGSHLSPRMPLYQQFGLF